MSLEVRTIVTSRGMFEENCHIVFCSETKEGAVIDPGGFSEADTAAIAKVIASLGLNIRHILNTHGHLDHIGGNLALKRATSAQILVHKDDAPMLANKVLNGSAIFGLAIESPEADCLLADGDTVAVGKSEFRVLHTPGHTKGSVCFAAPGLVFSGDTLFAGGIGRTDLPGGSLEEELFSIRNKLFALPENTVVYSGHGPATSIGAEKQFNPYV